VSAAEGGCPGCGSEVFEPDCPACVVVHLAEAAAHGLPGLTIGPGPGPVAGEGSVTAAGGVLAAYGRQVDELLAQVGDWQQSSQRYAAALTAALQELRGVLAELAGESSVTGSDEDGAR
jgi:hypothetical protein